MQSTVLLISVYRQHNTNYIESNRADKAHTTILKCILQLCTYDETDENWLTCLCAHAHTQPLPRLNKTFKLVVSLQAFPYT